MDTLCETIYENQISDTVIPESLFEDVYADPLNLSEELTLISSYKTLGDVIKHINEIFPKWYIGTIERYSHDYPDLASNWVKVCKEIDPNLVPKSIVVIGDELFMNNNHSLSRAYCELFVRLGFCVRRSSELITCGVCNAAVPRKEVHEYLVLQGFQNIPNTWSNLCSECVDCA